MTLDRLGFSTADLPLGCSALFLRRDFVLSHHGENLLPLRCLVRLGCSAPLYFMHICFPGFAHFAEVASVFTAKTCTLNHWLGIADLTVVGYYGIVDIGLGS